MWKLLRCREVDQVASQGGDQFWAAVVEAVQHVAADVATRCHLSVFGEWERRGPQLGAQMRSQRSFFRACTRYPQLRSFVESVSIRVMVCTRRDW